jgi:hypothetical protein
VALCQDVDDEREFWCAQADMKTESVDKRMCLDKIALCCALKVFVLSRESKRWTFLMIRNRLTKLYLNFTTE